MIPSLRKQFNASFTPEKYHAFLRRIDDACGTHVQFRLSETPCFFPKSLLDRLAENGKQTDPATGGKSGVSGAVGCVDSSGSSELRMSRHSRCLWQVDFGLVRDRTASCSLNWWSCRPSLPSYAYQGTLARSYIEVYGLENWASVSGNARLNFFLSGLDEKSYRELLRSAIVGTHDPENVILMEIHPQAQKTLPDFLLTEKMLGVRTVDIEAIKKQGSQLYYERNGSRVPIRRIYNRRLWMSSSARK